MKGSTMDNLFDQACNAYRAKMTANLPTLPSAEEALRAAVEPYEKQIAALRAGLSSAEDTTTELECPKCSAVFEDDGKEYPHGILCPECKGMVKGVIHPRVVKKRITQHQWDELQRKLATTLESVKTMRDTAHNNLMFDVELDLLVAHGREPDDSIWRKARRVRDALASIVQIGDRVIP